MPQIDTTPNRCLTPGCINRQNRNGLCLKCYGQAKKLIEAGKTTWESLEEMGLAELGRSDFLKAFEERLNNHKDK